MHEGTSEEDGAAAAAERKPWAMRVLEERYPACWYGNVQHTAGILVFFVALPGQSFFLGTLTPYLTAELGIATETVSFFFFCAFGGAAAWLQFVGRLVDKHGTRRMIMAAIVPFVAAIWGVSSSNNPMLTGFCYMMLRITGQETIAFSMTIAVNKWFVRRRARAAASLSLAIGAQMQVTAFIAFLMEAVGWREVVFLLGCITLCVTLAALPLLRDSPEEVGLGPDGQMKAEKKEVGPSDTVCELIEVEVNFTLEQAMGTVQFWFLLCMGATFGLTWGGINVHLWAVCDAKLLPAGSARLIYVFVGIGVPLGALCMGVLLDGAPRKDDKLRRSCVLPLAAGSAQMIAEVMRPEQSLLPPLFGFLSGAYVGMFQVMFSTIFAFFFGRRNLGSIQAMLVATNLFGVACGPLLLDFALRLRGSYVGIFAAIGALQYLFAAGLLFLKAPHSSSTWCGKARLAPGGSGSREVPMAGLDEVQDGGGEETAGLDEQGKREGRRRGEDGADGCTEEARREPDRQKLLELAQIEQDPVIRAVLDLYRGEGDTYRSRGRHNQPSDRGEVEQ
jgi:OFA family oxalate/formate antiporter-like MFS transporter